MSDEYKEYRVHLKSLPGMYAQYSGVVEVLALNDGDAETEAYKKLKRGAFPDRDASFWRLVKIERVFND